MNKQILFLILLALIVLLRINQIGGLGPYEGDPELEEIEYKFESTRWYLSERVDYLLPQPQAGLLAGMVLGVKTSLPPEFKKALRETSTLHIVVVSGQNLTLLSGFIMSLAYFFGRKKTLILTLFIITFYAILTGLQIPVLRAAFMVLLASLAQFFNREGQTFWILVVTALFMLIYNPTWLASISFQLSFLATIGVVVVAPEIIKRLKFIPDLLRQDLGVTVAAQLMVLPIIASNFHQVSVSGILVNSLILWTVPIIMISGAISLIGALINEFLGEVLVLIPGVFLTYFIYIVSAFDQKWSSFYIGNVNFLVWIGYYLLILGVFLYLKQINNTVKDNTS